MPDVALREHELVYRLGWLIRVRWLFIAGLAFAITAGATIFHLEFPVRKTIAVTAFVVLYNVAFSAAHYARRTRAAPGLATSRIEAGLQIGLDLVVLTMLIHFVGGIDSPFICLYLIHAIVGTMLLSKRAAWIVGCGVLALFLGLALLEYAALLPHYHPTGAATSRHAHGPFLLVFALAFVVTLVSTISITTAIVTGLRQREQQLIVTQNALLQNSQDLERAYASLTKQQKQLVQTEKQASLGQLVSGIAHEINNPIQFIHGNMTVLAEAFSDVLPILDAHGASDPQLRIARLDYAFFRRQISVLLEDMANGAARIAAIVRDLKTFARRDEGRLDERVELNEVVRASVRLLHNKLKHFRVEEDLDPRLPELRGNVTQMQQVAMNALQNAADAVTGRPDGTVRIRTRVEQHGAMVRFSVEDNGCGMTPEVKDRIFDPFFTTKQRIGGTGLGLSITYGIVQQHRGHIEVSSAPGAGTSFHFLLPVRQNGAHADPGHR
jgi:signal transduction histidine kinase